MTETERDAIVAGMERLDFRDRMAALTCTLMDAEPELIACIVKLGALQSYMSERLTKIDLMFFAEMLRGIADTAEKRARAKERLTA